MRRLVLAQVLANGPPAVVVGAFLVAFLDPDLEYALRNTMLLAVLGSLAFVLLVGLGRLHIPRELAWLLEGRVPTPRQRDRLLQAPLAGAAGAAAAWAAGAAIFTLANLDRPLSDALVTGGTILLGGASTSAIVYLAFERILRPLFAVALAQAPPQRPVGPSVGSRISTAWLLTSGVPALTILGVAVARLLGADVSADRLALAAAFFASGVLVAGLLALRAATHSVTEPITAMRSALARVEEGDLDVRIAIDDSTEVGLLQAGFNRMATSLGTYLDPAVAGHVLRHGSALAGEEVEVTAMFLDVRDFTGFASGASAAEVVSTLNGLFERVVPVVRAHGGHVDKFVGDGLLAVFGAPVRDPEHARHAVAAALEIERATRDQPLDFGIGLNSGPVVAGNVGGGGRLEFSVIGDAVNVAARVEAATRETGDRILVTARTRELVGDVAFAERPAVRLKGKAEPVSLFAPAPGADADRPGNRSRERGS